jgi:ribosomal protein L1
MPSPKAGTVSSKLTDTINEIKKGRIEFKLDK